MKALDRALIGIALAFTGIILFGVATDGQEILALIIAGIGGFILGSPE